MVYSLEGQWHISNICIVNGLGCGAVCSHMRHFYGQVKGGCVMDKDITALWGVDFNSSPGISGVFIRVVEKEGNIPKAGLL